MGVGIIRMRSFLRISYVCSYVLALLRGSAVIDGIIRVRSAPMYFSGV